MFRTKLSPKSFQAVLMRVLLLSVVSFLLLGAAVTSVQAKDMTISLWTHDQLYVQFFSETAEEWKERYPDVNFTFDFQVVPDVWTVVLTNLSAGEPIPDLLGIEQGMFPSFMKDGIIADKFVNLTPYIGDDYDKITKGRWTLYTYDGNVYGVDSSLSAIVYYYQPEILEKYNIEVPTTWDEFIEAGKAVAADGIALSPVTDNPSMFEAYLWQRGGAVFDQDGNFVFGNEENRQKTIEMLNMVREGLNSGAFKWIPRADYWSPAHLSQYAAGTLAGNIAPDWFSDSFLKTMTPELSGKWRMAVMPVWADGNGRSTSVWGGTGFAINKDSEDVDMVYDLLKYSYVEYEGQIKRYETIKYFPTRLDTIQDERITSISDPYFGGQQVGQVFAGVIADIPVWYQSPYRTIFREAVGMELPAFFEGKTTPEALIDAIVEFVEDEIAFDQ